MTEVRNNTPFFTVEYNKGQGLPSVVFLSGFPDNELSSWGTVIPEAMKKSYHVVFVCIPGYNKGSKLPAWGYSRPQLMSMLHETIEQVLPGNERFDFVTHDWGAHFGLLYENAHSEKIKTLTLIDVGMFTPFAVPLSHALIIFCYQSWFALSYVVSQVLGSTAGLIFMGFFFLPIFNCLRPTNEKIYVPIKEVTAEKCYTYYYTMKEMFTGALKFPKFPSCPTFYLYGKNKNAQFHDEKFLNKLTTRPGCQLKSYDAGHWPHVTQADLVLADLQSFLKANSK